MTDWKTRTIAPPYRPARFDPAELTKLWAAPGPYLSVLIDMTKPPQDRLGLWEHRIEELRDAGLPPAVLSVLEQALRSSLPPDYAGLAVLVASDGTAVGIASPDPLVSERMDVGLLPRTAVVLDWAQRSPSHVVVELAVDRITVTAFEPDGAVTSHQTDADPSDGLEFLAEIASEHQASLIALAGLPALAEEVRERLMPLVATDVRVVPIGDGSIDDLAAAAVRAVADDVARDTVEAVEALRLDRALGLAAEGVVDSVEALQEGRASTLIVHDDPDDQRLAWFGADPRDLSIDLEHAASTDTSHLQQGPLVEVLIRSCVLQDGVVRVVPAIDESRLSEGVGVVVSPRVLLHDPH